MECAAVMKDLCGRDKAVGCRRWYHVRCIDFQEPPEESDDWLCQICANALPMTAGNHDTDGLVLTKADIATGPWISAAQVREFEIAFPPGETGNETLQANLVEMRFEKLNYDFGSVTAKSWFLPPAIEYVIQRVIEEVNRGNLQHATWVVDSIDRAWADWEMIAHLLSGNPEYQGPCALAVEDIESHIEAHRKQEELDAVVVKEMPLPRDVQLTDHEGTDDYELLHQVSTYLRSCCEDRKQEALLMEHVCELANGMVEHYWYLENPLLSCLRSLQQKSVEQRPISTPERLVEDFIGHVRNLVAENKSHKAEQDATMKAAAKAKKAEVKKATVKNKKDTKQTAKAKQKKRKKDVLESKDESNPKPQVSLCCLSPFLFTFVTPMDVH